MKSGPLTATSPSSISRKALTIGLGAILGTTALTSLAVAEPDNCTGSSGGVFTCEGNQSEGIIVGSNSGTSLGASEVIVKNLTPLSNGDPYTGQFEWLALGNPAPQGKTLTFELDLDGITHEFSGQNGNIIFATNSGGETGTNISASVTDGTLRHDSGVTVILETGSNKGEDGAFGRSGSTPGNGGSGKPGGTTGSITFIASGEGDTTTYTGQNGGTIEIVSEAGAGGNGGTGGSDNAFSSVQTSGGAAGAGGATGDIAILTDGTAILTGAAAISIAATGGAGGTGGNANNADGIDGSGSGGRGGQGGFSDNIYFDTDADGNASKGEWQITSSADSAIFIESTGGDGGKGGGRLRGGGGYGGDGSNAGTIWFGEDGTRTISASGNNAVFARGTGGDGGGVGDSLGTESNDGSPRAGNGGIGSEFRIYGTWDVTGTGTNTAGLLLESQGGDGVNNDQNSENVPAGATGGGGGKAFITTDGASSITTPGAGFVLTTTGGTAGGGKPGGTGGAGGPVTLGADFDGNAGTGSWTITTKNEDAAGIALTSQGGVGGLGAGQEDTGATGGTGGAGGSITVVDGPSYTVTTSGDSAPGISLKSIGGKGGNPGSNQGGRFGKGGGGGAGGAISFDAEVDISTSGSGADGLYVESLGGGVSNDGTSFNPSGAGGTIDMTVDGSIKTTGGTAHGINVISSAGQAGPEDVGTGNVAVTVKGDVQATGNNAYGVSAQTLARNDGTPGTVSVTVPSGAKVEGAAAAIYLNSTSLKSVTNAGTIASTEGASGVAIRYAGSTSFSKDNSGTITGSVVGPSGAGAGEAEVDNRAGGIINAARLDADVTNRGLIVSAPGAAGLTVAGDFTQTEGGTVLASVGGDGAAPVAVQGRAEINGRVGVDITDESGLGALAGGSGSFEVLTAAGGVSLRGAAEAAGSAVARYQLDQADAETLRVVYDVDFANGDILNATNDSQDSLTAHLQELWERGVLSAEAADETVQLLAIEDPSEYAAVVNSLSGEVYANTQLSTLNSAQRFGDTLMSCSERAGAQRFTAEGQCGWFFAGGSEFDQDANESNTGFDESAFFVGGGAQFEVAPDTHLGFGLAYEDSSLSMQSASADGRQYYLGVSAKREIGAAMLAASVSGGFGDFDITRDLATGGRAKGTQDVSSLSAQLRGAYTLERGDWYVTPRVDLAVDRVETDAVRESGAGAFDLQIDDAGETYVSLQPAVEVGGETTLANGTVLRPTLTAGITQYLGNTAPEVSVVYDVTPDSADGFRSTAELDRTYFDLAAGLEVFATDRLSVRADAFTSVSDNTQSYGGGLRLEMAF